MFNEQSEQQMTYDNDSAFWERLAGMPDVEVEIEITSRKAFILREINKLHDFMDGRITRDSIEAGRKIRDNNLQLSMLNNYLKIVRKRMDRVCWRNAVMEALGQEAFEKCLIWMEQNSLK